MPAILRANACPHMVLNGRVHKGVLGIGRRVEVSAYCTLSQGPVAEPEVGCGQCHPIPVAFIEEDEK